jgi:glycosyltransferase involved in cell wall biosynthesis
LTPLITTIIPTFQRPKLLKRAITSVLNQTYPYFQIYVCDNASQDETETIVFELAKTDPRIKYYRHSKNIGAWPNFQYGLERVNTEFFSYLSDDDVLFPWFYQTVLQGFDKFPQAALSAGSTIMMKDDGSILDVSLRSWPKEGCYSPPQSMLLASSFASQLWIR